MRIATSTALALLASLAFAPYDVHAQAVSPDTTGRDGTSDSAGLTDAPPVADASDASSAAHATDTANATGVAIATAAAAPAAQILRRMVVIGASASYGINLRASLADALGALVAVPHEAPLDGALGGFSMASLETREQVVELAAARDPSALIAVDFLFWYVHGFVRDADRLPRVKAALALLERFECPVVIGLVPDMSPAAGAVAAATWLPGHATLLEINRCVTDWATRRPNVVVVPLLEAMADMRSERALTVGPWTWPAGDEFRFVQRDRTHPTEDGLLVMARLVVEGLRARFPSLPAEAFVADRELVRAGMLRLAAAHPWPRSAPPDEPAPSGAAEPSVAPAR